MDGCQSRRDERPFAASPGKAVYLNTKRNKIGLFRNMAVPAFCG